MINVCFIILGAGIGSRMGLSIPKQYLKIHGEYVIEMVIKVLCGDLVDKLNDQTTDQINYKEQYQLKSIVMTYGNDSIYLEDIKTHITNFDKQQIVSYVKGGYTRQESIKNAYSYIYDEVYIRRKNVEYKNKELTHRHELISKDIFIIHDGTRPNVTAELYYDIIVKTNQYDVCGCYTVSIDTIVELDEQMEYMLQRYDRTRSVCSETPQGFKGYIMNAVYIDNTLENPNETECLLLGQVMSGKKPYMIKTDMQTRKLTYFEDIFTLTAIKSFKMKKNIFVLGGTRGIGLRLVEKLLSYDFDVITGSRNEVHIISAQKQIKERLEIELDAHVCDITKKDDIEKVIKYINEKYGGVDVFINCVGNLIVGNIEDVSYESILNVIQPNYIGAFVCNKMVFTDMKNNKKRGIIINIGSSGIEGNREGQSMYTFSKNALLGLSESLMLEGKKYGISSFYVSPRRTNTEMRRLVFPNEDKNTLLNPDDVADIIMELVLSNIGNISENSTIWIK